MCCAHADGVATCRAWRQELDDKFVLTSAASSFLQNAILVAQILLLGPDKKTQDKKIKKKS